MHYIWKTIDGVKDVVVFHSGKVPEQITLSSHGKKALQSNCIRCHEVAVTMIDKERKCWECHRRITHKLTGTIETL
jgi:cytochrome c nitrite reductase small subunit